MTSPACPALIVAGKEFRDCVRSRWLLFGSAIFAALSLAVFFGTAAIGGTLKYQPLATVLNAWLSLTVFLLPLLALLLSYDAFVGEAESGTLLLMLTYPIGRLQWLGGKALGQGAALAAVLAAGACALAAASAIPGVPYGWRDMLAPVAFVAATSWLLGMLFILAGYCASLVAREKAQALAFLLLLWFAAVLLYDLLLLVIAVAGADVLSREALTAMLLANPASLYRIVNQTLLGTASITVPLGAAGLLAAWCAALFALAGLLLARRRL
ncbi:MAG: ABC transporter permease subunit [Duodenibacillus sp.]|nr:ABC transporter permease subunit [Duodenibacillus sp.]